MVQALVPVLILATVALSSSTILPLLYKNLLDTETIDLNGQENDNILSNKFNSIHLPGNQFLSTHFDEQDDINGELEKARLNLPNNEWINDEKMNKNENYNGEGFRQEQWHNYPRQLDRLRKYLYEYYNIDKKNANEHFHEDGTKEEIPDEGQNHEIIYEKDSSENLDRQYDPGSANPKLQKIQFVLDNDIESILIPQVQLSKNMDTQEHSDINSHISLLKVKREDIKDPPDNELENTADDNKVVAKRIFSLWSRLQGLNHNRGHELHHRRHLHAFYGLPDSDGGGTLTAETRATLMRPPGSPLRWG